MRDVNLFVRYFRFLAECIKSVILLPHNVSEMRRILSKVEIAIDTPRASKLGKAITDDLNIIFKYLSSGIELHPYVKRESDALVIDFREANKDAQVRYQLAGSHVKDDAAVLDCSCGYGGGTHFLAVNTKAASIVGADVFFPAIEYARRVFGCTNSKLEFEVASATDEFSFENEKFDVIISLETVEHIQNDSIALSCFRKWVKPGGKIIISVPNQDVLPFDQLKYPYHVRHYTTQSLRILGESVGLRLVESLFFGHDGAMIPEGPQILAVFEKPD